MNEMFVVPWATEFDVKLIVFTNTSTERSAQSRLLKQILFIQKALVQSRVCVEVDVSLILIALTES